MWDLPSHSRSGDDKYNPKYYKGQHKESKEARRARNKAAKRAKFDPEQSETTRQVQERLQPPRSTPQPQPPPPPMAGNNSRIEALREKLHARLAEKASQRPSDPNVVSKRAARRAEKQRRKDEAKKKRASTQVKEVSKTNFIMSESSSRAVVDDLQTLDYGKLAGLNPTPKQYQNNKALANLNKTKNLEKLLADAEEKKQRLIELKRGNEQDKQKALDMQWGDTLREASGERVKDDPAKLKRELKRKLAKKQKSAKAWKSRLDQKKETMEQRLKIRKHNVETRKLGGEAGANLSKKRIATEEENDMTRRRSRPGFEGKKQEFLNQGKKNQ